MNRLRIEIVRSICEHKMIYNFSGAVYEFMDNEFVLHEDLSKGYVLDPNLEPQQCHMIEYVTGVVVKLTANKFFGTTVEIVEDPNNILESHELKECPHLYDSTSHLNKANK